MFIHNTFLFSVYSQNSLKPFEVSLRATSPTSFVAKLDKRNIWRRRELIQLTFLSFVVTAQRSKTHYVILRKTENNYELFGYSPAPLTNKERLNERGKAKPVFKSEHPRSVTQCNTVKLFSKLHFVHIKVVYI